MSYKILIIDHDLTSADEIRGRLADAGYDAVVAESAAEGRKAFERDRPDLTLIEVQLPKKPGFELCRELKEIGEADEVRVVLVGDESSLQDVAEIAQSGCDDLIQKPVDGDRLAAVCEALLTETTEEDVEDEEEDEDVAAIEDEAAVVEASDEDAAVSEDETDADDEAVAEVETDDAMLGRSDVNDAMGQLESIVEESSGLESAGGELQDDVDDTAPISAAEAAGDFSHILVDTEREMNRDRPAADEQLHVDTSSASTGDEERTGGIEQLLAGSEAGEDIEAHLDSLFSGAPSTVSPPPAQPVIPRSVESSSEPAPAEPVNVAAETAEETTAARTDSVVVWENLDAPAGDTPETAPQATVAGPEPSVPASTPPVAPTASLGPSQTARIDEPMIPRSYDQQTDIAEPLAPSDAVGSLNEIPPRSIDETPSAPRARGILWIAVAAVVVVGLGVGLWLRSPSPESTAQASDTSTPTGDARAFTAPLVTTPTPNVDASVVEDLADASSADAEPVKFGLATPPAEPVATAKPTTTATKPVATAKPTTTATKPVATAKPTTTATKPVATAKPTTAATKPVATAKPTTAATKPVATAKPTTTATKPVATAKPTTTATKPVATAKPTTAGTGSVVTAPVATLKPASDAPSTTEPSKPEPVATRPTASSAAPTPAPAEVGLEPPVVLERFEPTYPPKALKRGGGTVVLKVLVNERGGISRVLVEQGLSGSELEAAAISAVLRWRYQPATENGEPVKAWAKARFVFEP